MLEASAFQLFILVLAGWLDLVCRIRLETEEHRDGTYWIEVERVVSLADV